MVWLQLIANFERKKSFSGINTNRVLKWNEPLGSLMGELLARLKLFKPTPDVDKQIFWSKWKATTLQLQGLQGKLSRQSTSKMYISDSFCTSTSLWARTWHWFRPRDKGTGKMQAKVVSPERDLIITICFPCNIVNILSNHLWSLRSTKVWFLLYMMFFLTSISSGTTDTRAMFRKPPAVKGRMYLEKTYHSRKSWFYGELFVQIQVYYLLTWAVSLDHRCSQRRAPRGPPTSRPGLCWSEL